MSFLTPTGEVIRSFDYNGLNIVGRDREMIEYWQKTLKGVLERLKTNVSVNGKSFKKLVNVANEVWAGEDQKLFINNITSTVNEFSSSIDTLITNIDKYFQADLSSFDSLQKSNKKIAKKV